MKTFKMELLNSEEMKGLTGGVAAGTILACTAQAKVIACQTMEVDCSGGTFTSSGCNGTNKFGAICVPSNAFTLNCISGYCKPPTATVSVSDSISANVSAVSFTPIALKL